MVFAVGAETAATPRPFVTAVAELDALKTALAPLAGAVKVTVTPLSGLLPASLTVACRGRAKAVPTGVLCVLPLVAVTVAADELFWRPKLAAVATPDTAAV